MRHASVLFAAGLLLICFTATNYAQGPGGPGSRQRREAGEQRGRGFGPGGGRGFGRGMGRRLQGQSSTAEGQHGPDERHDEDHQVFQYLLQHHDRITRKVTELPDGVETLTESSDPEVAQHIKEHVEWMTYRVEEGHPIRMRDPLFAELFRHVDKIKMVSSDTPQGVKVVETSTDPYVAKLIQEHAKVVSKFVEHGFAEAMKNHAVPAHGSSTTNASVQPEPHYPIVAGVGAVVTLPNAAMQPRAGTRLLVDVTRGGDPAEVNSALEKVAKYLNIYAGGGAEPAQCDVAVVLHGDATLSILNDDAYQQQFGVISNPNTELLKKLHDGGVEFYVCGQTLISKGAAPEEVIVFVQTAVSALTAVVNLQADGYAYLPLGR